MLKETRSSLVLSKADLKEATGYTQPTRQKRALDAMGIPYRERPDGRPVVLLPDIDNASWPSSTEPNWSALDD